MIKLVRDRIPEIIESKGQPVPRHWTAEDAEFKALLRAKLVEEVDEYLKSDDVWELADVLEVVWALSGVLHGHLHYDLMALANEKRNDRGGFHDQIAMEFPDTQSSE